MFCYECGKSRKPGGKFCGHCGVNFVANDVLVSDVASNVNPDVSQSPSPEARYGPRPGANFNTGTDGMTPGPTAAPGRTRTQQRRRKKSNATVGIVTALILIVAIVFIIFLLFQSGGTSTSGRFDVVGMWMTPNGTIISFNSDGTVGPMLFGFDGGPSGAWSISSGTDENGHYTLQASHITGGAPVFKVEVISNDEIKLRAESGVYFGSNFYHLFRQ